MSEQNPWEENWEYNNATDETGPWNDEWGGKGSGTKSGQTMRNLPFLNNYQVGALEGALGVGSTIAGMAGQGLATIATMGYDAINPNKEVDVARAVSVGEAVKDKLTYEPKYQEGQSVVEAVGAGGEMLAKGAKFAGSGYAGLATLPGGIEQSARSVEEFQKAEDPLGEGVLQVTGSPAMAAGAKILPDIAAMGVKPRPRPNNKPGPYGQIEDMADIPEGYGGVTGEVIPAKPISGWKKPSGQTAVKSDFDEARKAIQAGDRERLAEIVNANPAIVAAFEELGIQYSPAMVSDNAAFRALQSGMKSKPESGLGAVDDTVHGQLVEMSDDLINRIGTTDRSILDEAVRTEFQTLRTGMWDEAKRLYGEIDEILDGTETGTRVRREPVNVDALRESLETRIRDLDVDGDIDAGLRSRAISAQDKKLWQLTNRKVDVDVSDGNGNTVTVKEWQPHDPTYAELDAYRKGVGDSLGGKGPYGESNRGDLSTIYGELAEAQQAVADAYGFGPTYKAATEAVVKRKALEDAAVLALGDDLVRGVLPKIDTIANDLVKGKVGSFNELMIALPTKELRQTVAAGILNNMFAPGAQKGVKIKASFGDSVDALNRNSRAKDALFAELPSGVRARFDIIAKASEGFYRSLLKDNRSNTANANSVIQSIEDGSFWKRLYASSQRFPGLRIVLSETRGGMAQRRLQAADDLLMGGSLESAIKEYALETGKAKQLALQNTKQYQAWYKTLDQASRSEIDRIGFVPFLIAGTVEGQQ